MRTRTLLLLAIVVTVVPLWLAGVAEGGRPAPDPGVPHVAVRPAPPAVRALAVLRRWDRRRAHAWAVGDADALARLYVRGSETGARDGRDLHRWVRRGLRVAGLRQQVAAFRLADRRPGRMVLVVTDRTVDGVAVHRARRTPIPRSAWATHRIVLRRSAGRWRVDEVRAQPAR